MLRRRNRIPYPNLTLSLQVKADEMRLQRTQEMVRFRRTERYLTQLIIPFCSVEFFRHATVECVISISVMLKTSSLLVTEAVNELEPAADTLDVATDAAAFTFEGDCGTSGFWSGGRESAWKSEEAVPLHRPASAGSESRKYSDEAGSDNSSTVSSRLFPTTSGNASAKSSSST